ncbi:MAG: NAD-glutamate dehydrogenase, partial [Steroidobacteraceae bacterium]
MHARDPSSDDSRLLRSIPPARLALIERIARARLAPGHGPPAASGAALYREMRQRFLRAYFRGVGEEDLAERAPATLAGAARSHLELGWRRAPGETLVRIFNPDRQRDGFESPHTVVQIVTDDSPFLVDSVGIALGRAGLAMHLIIHPVLEVRRDARGRLAGLGANGGQPHQAESWELYEIDRQTDAAAIERLRRDIESTLTDVSLAVDDWPAMRKRVRALVADLERDPPPLATDEATEARQLLEWMEERHFVFLGYRYYRLERGAREDRLIPDARTGLGILRSRGAGSQPAATLLAGDVRARARERELLVLTKANSVSTVHRAEYLDYAGVKSFDGRGRVTGEHRFLGLWTSSAYHRSPRDIPVLRRKVDRVIQYFGLDPHGHDGKAVLNVLETYPRDELFQAS